MRRKLVLFVVLRILGLSMYFCELQLERWSLDGHCIGSAFNIKGAMQCPNCRKFEKGQWLYANCSRLYPEFSVDELTHDEDLYDLSFSEMSFGVHWCPFGSLARLPSSFEQGEFPSTYHELPGQHAIFTEHSLSATHPRPYLAYFGPMILPSSSNSSGSVSDSSSFNDHWNGPSVPSEIPTSYAFPAMDLRYHTRNGSDMPRSGSFMHPFVVGHSSGARAASVVPSSFIPAYSGNAWARERVQALQAYYQHHHPSILPALRTPCISGSRRSGSHRNQAYVGPVASSSDHTGGFYFIASGWVSFHEAATSGSDRGIRPSIFRQRHGSESQRRS
ncbi:RING/U-box superfamily protein isoform 2 [Hibiscus syriacus]|uniref:RING/U-box superfamily protein isoform 2 n=1 Tax=Hibiscus syriacus TaxID=106335 RepID=A0A6A3CVP7_HIBSY|nr:RING/U-box superfamily protein isoform 2 [Hibiscus syriacus]